MSIKNVAVAGASGNLGPVVIEELLNSKNFNITILSRKDSTATNIPEGVKLIKVDYNSHEELVQALKGQDAVVNLVASPLILEVQSKALITAAVEAGVKRFVPSEFGGDLNKETGPGRAIVATKQNIAQFYKALVDEGKIEYTTFCVGPFFDWGLQVGFLGFDLKNKKATLWDNGQHKYNTTNIRTIGKAIASSLSNPQFSKNKSVLVHDFFLNQQEILSILESKLGKFEITNVNAVEDVKEKSERLAGGDFSLPVVFGILQGSVFGPNSSSRWGVDDDSEFLGLPRLSLEEEVAKLV